MNILIEMDIKMNIRAKSRYKRFYGFFVKGILQRPKTTEEHTFKRSFMTV